MATVKQIREAIAGNLAVLDGAQISAYRLGNATPPVLMVMLGPPGGGDFTEYHQAMGAVGLSRKAFAVRCEVALNMDIGAQQRLDAFLDDGPGSVKAAVEKRDGPNGEVTLGGLVSDVKVLRSVAGLVETPDGSSQKLAAEWEIQVYT